MTGLLFNLSGARPRCVVSVGLVGLLASSTNKTLWDLDFTLAILSGCTREFAHRFQGGDFHTQNLCMVWFAVNLLEDLS